MSVAVLIGEGPNDIEVPCMLFPSMETAREKLDPILGEPDKETEKKVRWWKNAEDHAERFFTSYYDGCGECYSFTLKMVEYNKPFVGWDLD